MEPSALSLLPSLLAIAFALYTRNVLLSLFSGIVVGLFLINDFALFLSLEALYELFKELLSTAWILKTLAFALLVGSVMSLIERSGGIEGFVDYVVEKKSFVSSERSSLMLSFSIGILIFIESSITALIAGAVGKPLCERYKVAEAKLAFVCDSTSAPISSLLVFNAWGALLLGLISTQVSLGILEATSIDILIDAVLYNFYAMSAIAITFISIYFGVDIATMKDAKCTINTIKSRDIKKTNPYYMLLPIAVMLMGVFIFLYITGDGDILKGSGSSSLFYTMLLTLFCMLWLYVPTKNMTARVWFATAYEGAKKLFPIASILLFAFAIGKVTVALETGLYLASLASETLSIHFLAVVIFLLSAVIAFSTGTSWGTFSIMIPVAVPMAVGMDANVALCIGAVISGGVFGDHCSPISDTSIISSMATECDVVEHVRTQLPYALISGCIAILLFILFSF